MRSAKGEGVTEERLVKWDVRKRGGGDNKEMAKRKKLNIQCLNFVFV